MIIITIIIIIIIISIIITIIFNKNHVLQTMAVYKTSSTIIVEIWWNQICVRISGMPGSTG